MANKELFARVEDYTASSAELVRKADALVADFAGAIFERLTELFDAREAIQLIFEEWLRTQFNTDPYVSWDIFAKDSQLRQLLQAVDATQCSRSKVAEAVNVKLLGIPSRIGVNRSFVEVAALELG
jgi:hypothetical protein